MPRPCVARKSSLGTLFGRRVDIGKASGAVRSNSSDLSRVAETGVLRPGDIKLMCNYPRIEQLHFVYSVLQTWKRLQMN